MAVQRWTHFGAAVQRRIRLVAAVQRQICLVADLVKLMAWHLLFLHLRYVFS